VIAGIIHEKPTLCGWAFLRLVGVRVSLGADPTGFDRFGVLVVLVQL